MRNFRAWRVNFTHTSGHWWGGAIERLCLRQWPFVGSGYGGVILVSTNGEDWARVNSGTTADLYNVAYGNGIFLVVGNAGTILSSTNGLNWTSHDSGTMNPVLGIGYGAGTFIAVGAPGMILQSGVMPLLSTQLYPFPGWTNAGFGLSLTSAPGETWEVQTSSDLLKWTPIGSILVTNSTALFFDRDAKNFGRRFYRAVEP